MAAGRTDQPARRIRLQPALVFAAVPDAVFGAQHPAASLAVQHRKVSDRQPERSRQHPARASLFNEDLEADLSFGKRIDCHAESIARGGLWIQ